MQGQRIVTDKQFVHPLFEHIVDLYITAQRFTDSDLGVGGVYKALMPLFNCLCVGAGKQVSYSSVDSPIALTRYMVPILIDKQNCVTVCFSGGKDSTALAMKLKEEGKNVYLYFLKGINKSYPDEYKRAEKVASILGLPLYIDEIKLSGKSAFKENPMKNQVVATFALNYAIQHNLGCHIAFGDFTDDTADKAAWDRNWSDTVEMWDAYRSVISSIIPGFQLLTPFKNYTETLAIVSKNQEILENVQGCLAPMRFREHWREQNTKKYGNVLLPNRCGSCWKCCVEYIYLVGQLKGFQIERLGLEDKGYFITHCLRILKSRLSTEHPYIKEVKATKDLHEIYLPGCYIPDLVQCIVYDSL